MSGGDDSGKEKDGGGEAVGASAAPVEGGRGEAIPDGITPPLPAPRESENDP